MTDSASSAPTVLSLRGGDYPVTRGLAGVYEGGECDGFELRYDACGAEAAFATILEARPFQVCEFSLANFGMLRDRGADHLVAIPVFLNRAFRHGVAWTRDDSAMDDLGALVGKRVGMKEYSQTAAVWFRGLLSDEYGVDWRDIEWFVPRKQRFPAPQEARVTDIDGDLEALVLDGTLDAYVSTRVSKPGLRPVQRDHAAAADDYRRRTGILPINHAVLIERGVLNAHPRAAHAVFDAYCKARARANDPNRHGFAGSNRLNVETVFRYLHEQRLTSALPTIDALFELKDATDARDVI